jgi:hypothetical protein
MADVIVSDTPEWHSADADTQQAIANLSFNRMYGNDKTYQNASAEDKALTREAFNNVLSNTAYKSEYNKVNIDAAAKQEDSDNSGYLSNLFTKVLDSHKDLVSRLPITGDALNQDGSVGSSFANNASKYFEKQKGRIYTSEDKAVAKTLLDVEKKIEKNGFWSWDGVKAMVAAVPELVANPGGVINVGADSISSMTSIAAGAAAGGAAGSVVPGLGTAIGAGAGMFAAESGDALSSKFLELAEDKLKSIGLPPTKQNLALLAQNKEWVQSAQEKALTYSTTLAAADTALGAGLGRVFSAPARAALNKARIIVAAGDQTAITIAAKASGVAVEKYTENEVNKVASAIMSAHSFKSKLGHFAGHATGEALSEPATEAIATSSIGEPLTFTNLANELLGGVGSGPLGAVVDRAAFGTKIAADKTKSFVGNILSATPESKVMAKIQKESLVAANKLNVTQADANYKKDIATIEHTDDTHVEMSDPANPNYNPIKATEILTKYDTPDAYNKASEIEAHERKSYLETMTRLQELASKTESGETLSKVEEVEFDGLTKLMPEQEARVEKLNGFVDIIYANAQAKRNKERDAVTLDPKTATQSQIVESVSFGSSAHKNELTNDNIDELIKRPDLDTDVKALLADKKEASAIRQAIEEKATRSNTTGKTIAEVSNDIYHGIKGSDFKGIDSYIQGITHFLNPQVNNTAKATAELNGLEKFRDVHVAKAEMVQAVYDHVTKGVPLSAKHQVAYAEAQAKAKAVGKTFVIDQRSGLGANPLIGNIKEEAAALNSEVKLAKSLFKTLSNKTNTSTSTVAQTAPTASNIKPTESVPVVTSPVATKPVVESKPVVDTPQKPVEKTGKKRLTALQAELKTGNVTEKGLKEIRDIYQAAKKNNDHQDYLDNITELGTKYKEAWIKSNKANEGSKNETSKPIQTETTVKPEGDTETVTAASKTETGDYGSTKAGFKPNSRLVVGSYENTDGEVVETKGRLIEFHGLSEFKFMAHKADGLGYTVYETSIGKRMGGHYTTQTEAIAKAEAAFKNTGIEKVYELINKARQDIGLEPITYTKEAQTAPETTAKPEAIVTPTSDEVVAPQVQPETVTEAPVEVADNLSAVDNIGDIEIQVGVDANGKPIMKLYSEAIADIDSQIDEANDILKCVKSNVLKDNI